MFLFPIILFCYLLILHLICVFLFAVKQDYVKFKQDDRDGGEFFVGLKRNIIETNTSTKVPTSVKVISIQALSQRMFVVLDSAGDLHLLSLTSPGVLADNTGHIQQLPHVMNVQNLAVLPDISASMHLFLGSVYCLQSFFVFLLLFWKKKIAMTCGRLKWCLVGSPYCIDKSSHQLWQWFFYLLANIFLIEKSIYWLTENSDNACIVNLVYFWTRAACLFNDIFI